MKYLGGKHRIGKEISEILLKMAPPDKVKGYIEPFCGSLGVFKHMTKFGYKKYIGCDIHPDLIKLWQECQDGTFKLPRKVSEKTWNTVKNKPSPNAMKAYVGFNISFGGCFFSGYSAKYSGKRDFNKEGANSIKKITSSIRGKNINFKCKSYHQLKPKGYLIYCDPPYKETTGFNGTKPFNTQKFWEKIKEWSKHNIVVVSEYKAPRGFRCIWKKSTNISVCNNTGAKENIEKLFIIRA